MADRDIYWDGVTAEVVDQVPGSPPFSIGPNGDGSTVPPGFDCDPDTGVVTSGQFGPAPTTVAISENKSGISLVVSGDYGDKYLVENQYWDDLSDPRCVVHVESETEIDFPQNANKQLNFYNGEMAVTLGGNVFITGPREDCPTIVRLDQEGSNRGNWEIGNPNFMEWTGPTKIRDLFIAPGVPLAGSVGDNGETENAANFADGTFFRYGTEDEETGEEWHTADVASDDSAVPVWGGDPDVPGLIAQGGPISTAYISGGKRYVFVVNPKAPALSFVCQDANAKWYRTPKKVYFVGKIHPQWVYVEGNVNLEIAGLRRRRCQYKIGSGDWTLYTGPLDCAALFDDDTEYTLSYRFSTNPSVVKTVTLHYNPAFPSDAEDHPLPIDFEDAADKARYVARCLDTTDPTPTRHLFNDLYLEDLGQAFRNGESAPYLIPLRDGKRSRYVSGISGAAPIQALVEGWGAVSDARKLFWRDGMLDNVLIGIDPIGMERIHGIGGPCMERYLSGGYTTSGPAIQMALDYTHHIKQFRKGLVTHGFSAVEDYRIRDVMAAFAMQAAQQQSSCTLTGNQSPVDTGMWGTAWDLGGLAVAMAMPEYDTPYFGTSGSPRGSEPAARFYAPWSGDKYVWWQYFRDPDITPAVWPGAVRPTGFYGFWNPDTLECGSRRGYSDADYLMGHIFYELMHFLWNYANERVAHVEKMFVKMADGSGVVPQLFPDTEGYARVISAAFELTAVHNAAGPNGYVEFTGDLTDIMVSGQDVSLVLGTADGDFTVDHSTYDGTTYTRVYLQETLSGATVAGYLVLPFRSNEGYMPFPALVNHKLPFTAAATESGPTASIAAKLDKIYLATLPDNGYVMQLWRHPFRQGYEDDWEDLVP